MSGSLSGSTVYLVAKTAHEEIEFWRLPFPEREDAETHMAELQSHGDAIVYDIEPV